MRKQNVQQGVSIVETLIYMALLAVIALGLVQGMYSLTTSYRNVRVYRSIETASVQSMDRIIRDIRSATGINTSQTSYNVSQGSLSLNTVDSNGTGMTVRYYLATTTSQIMVEENGSLLGPITPSDMSVDSLIFRSYATTTSSAIKVEMIMSNSTTTPVDFSQNFYGTAILRGTY
ncbi:MAG: hypothetical protein FGM57_00575 [Candidatus Taylorbacteria bacterium]|nr:hypothetical protein [Candidatus Taylorbacteria bacterium]